MTPSSHAVTQAAAVLTDAFVAGLWQGAGLTLLAAALMRLMPRISATLRHTLLLVSFLVVLLLPWVRPGSEHTHASGADHAVRIAPWLATAVALAWVAAACARALQLAVAWRHLRAVRRAATPVAVEGIAGFTAGSRRARLLASPAVDSPTILGFWSPALLLPEWMLPTLSADELQQIALHECEHLRRHDDWLNLLLQLGLTASPLNPGLLWLNRRIGVQRELACDEAVVASTGQPIAYASCLARLAEQRLQQRSRLRLALAAWERRSELAQRIHALLQGSSIVPARHSRLRTAGAAVLLLATSLGLARAPRFVRIGDDSVALAGTQPAAPIPGLPAAAGSVSTAAQGGDFVLTGAGHRAPVRMVSAVFPMKQAPAHPLHTAARKPKAAAERKPQPRAAAHVRIAEPEGPHMLRTSADFPTDHPAGVSGRNADTPVRFTTAEFSTPYVAVPLPGGWLLIQL